MNCKSNTFVQSQATIYLAEHRGCTQTEAFRSLHTFNFGEYMDESRKPPGNLIAFNEETLGGGNSIAFSVKEATSVLLLPLVGKVEFKSGIKAGSVEAGACCIFTVSENSSYELSNPFTDDLISYLHIQIRVTVIFENRQIEFDGNQNRLIPLITGIPNHIGRFDGRREGVYSNRGSINNTFLFVIEGAFEVQNRLLQSGDGLLLRDIESIDWEALSNDAIILLMEI